MGADARTFIEVLPILVISMTLHELAHGYVAWRLGDATAKSLGRLSLNPIRHVDPLGTAMFGITYFGSGGSFIFGWAKPIPVQPGAFQHPQRGMALVGIAGPVTNFVIALGLAAYLVHVGAQGEIDRVLELALLMNIVLGVFNLIPIPPLDGSRVVGAFMDAATYRRWVEFDQYGMAVIFVLFFVFRVQSQTALNEATDQVLRVIARLVGG